jgi:hypothetical protein
MNEGTVVGNDVGILVGTNEGTVVLKEVGFEEGLNEGRKVDFAEG